MAMRCDCGTGMESAHPQKMDPMEKHAAARLAYQVRAPLVCSAMVIRNLFESDMKLSAPEMLG